VVELGVEVLFRWCYEGRMSVFLQYYKGSTECGIGSESGGKRDLYCTVYVE